MSDVSLSCPQHRTRTLPSNFQRPPATTASGLPARGEPVPLTRSIPNHRLTNFLASFSSNKKTFTVANRSRLPRCSACRTPRKGAGKGDCGERPMRERSIRWASASPRNTTVPPGAAYSRSVKTTERYEIGPEWIASIPCKAVASNSSESPALTATDFAP
jgi:hypothetical protein